MDSITQGLLGATIAEAGFRRRLGGRAVAWGAVCAIAPDFDMVAALAGEWASLLHHRGVSHSWVAQTALAPVLGWLAWRFAGQRRGSWVSWAHLTWWALVTHPALDVCTAYGTQLLAPISRHRFAIDAVSIVDLLYTLPLLAAVVRARRGKDRLRSARFSAAMLALTTAYLAFGYWQSQRAIAWAQQDLSRRGFEAAEIRALPTLGNQFVYRLAARDGHGRYRLAMLSWSAPRPVRWYEARDDEHPLVERARQSERGRIFRWFAMGYAHSELREAEDGGALVRMSDLRYGSMLDPRQAMWGADARFDERGRLAEVTRWQARSDRDMRAELAALWGYLTGGPIEGRGRAHRGSTRRGPGTDGEGRGAGSRLSRGGTAPDRSISGSR